MSNNSDTSFFSTLISEFEFSPVPVTATHQQGNTLDFAIVSTSLLYSVHSISLDSSIWIRDHYPISFSLYPDSLLSSHLPSLARNRGLITNLDHTAFSSSRSQCLASLEPNPTITLKDNLSNFNDAIFQTLTARPFSEPYF